MTMPAGKYYIGDLCYAMTEKEWDEFCSITIAANDVLNGEFQLPDGRRFATYCTKWGDGTYSDNRGNSYPVDAGLIGCFLVADINPEKLENALDLGTVIDFDRDFTTESDSGMIRIGSVMIDTDPEPEDADEDDYGCGDDDYSDEE
jgi:hypothetical protein